VALGFPPNISVREHGAGEVHPFTETRGEWTSGRSPGLKAWAYWFRRGGKGFDLHIPLYGRESFWDEAQSAPELLAHVARFDRATGGVAWKGNGTITSDAFLRRRLRRVLAPTELPPPVESAKAREVALIWCREPRSSERGFHYVHALDLNLAYAAPASSIALPTGACNHLELPTWRRGDAGVYLVEVEGSAKWVTAPTMERLQAKGHAALEGYVWPSSGRHLRPWYEMISHARAELLGVGGPPLDALKAVCHEGVARLQSKARTVPEGKTLADDPTYQPYWSWALIAELRERLLARVEALDVEPLAIDTDCLFFLSSRSSPSALAVRLGLPLGDGLGQFKPAGSCSARDAREAMAGLRSANAVDALRDLCKAGPPR
jgi:hypothetical protein